jgi:hypothetical protein
MKIHTRALVALLAMMLALPAWAAAQLGMVNALDSAGTAGRRGDGRLPHHQQWR